MKPSAAELADRAAATSPWADTPDVTPYAEGFEYGYSGLSLRALLRTWAPDRHDIVRAGYDAGAATRKEQNK